MWVSWFITCCSFSALAQSPIGNSFLFLLHLCGGEKLSCFVGCVKEEKMNFKSILKSASETPRNDMAKVTPLRVLYLAR